MFCFLYILCTRTEFLLSKNELDRSLVLSVWKGLFCGTVKYPNTKCQRLIIAGAITYSSQLYECLLRVDESINTAQDVQIEQSVKDKVKTILLRISNTGPGGFKNEKPSICYNAFGENKSRKVLGLQVRFVILYVDQKMCNVQPK